MSRGSARGRGYGEPTPVWRPRGPVRRRAGRLRRTAAFLTRVCAIVLYVAWRLAAILLGTCLRGVWRFARAPRTRIGAVAVLLGTWVLAAAPLPMHEPTQWPFIASPNVDDRPPGVRVSAIVLHATEIDTLAGTIGCFRSPATKVSAHFVVDRDGTVVQMVAVSRRAWHAGRSALEGVANVSHCSVGIEMVSLGDGKDPYPAAQIRAAASIVREVRQRAHVPDRRSVRHADVARPLGRKIDPLGFDMRAFRRLCREAP